MSDLDIDVTMMDNGNEGFAIIRLPERCRLLSSTIRNGGFAESDTVFFYEVPLGYDNSFPEDDMEQQCRKFNVPTHAVGFMTAADIRRVITVSKEEVNGVQAIAVATAGVTNALYAGERLPKEVLDTLPRHRPPVDRNPPGTINILVLVNVPLEDCGLANAFITVTEAKTAALMDTGVDGTGTTSDAVSVACPVGQGSKYAGTATDVGIAIARAVRSAVGASVIKWGNGKRPKVFLTRLDEMGVGEKEMWEAASALYVPNPDWDSEMIHQMFLRHLSVLRKDINVNAMICAAIRMEEMGREDALFGLDGGRFMEDPVHLVADELLGMALSQYVAGTKGLFEYIRYDKKKPGVLGTLGPFLDDIVASLIGSIMSRVYTELLEGEDRLGS